jgi:hypothetical protein
MRNNIETGSGQLSELWLCDMKQHKQVYGSCPHYGCVMSNNIQRCLGQLSELVLWCNNKTAPDNSFSFGYCFLRCRFFTSLRTSIAGGRKTSEGHLDARCQTDVNFVTTYMDGTQNHFKSRFICFV